MNVITFETKNDSYNHEINRHKREFWMHWSLFIEPEMVKNHRQNCEKWKIFKTVLKIYTVNYVSKDEEIRGNSKNISGKGMNEFKLNIKNTETIWDSLD